MSETMKTLKELADDTLDAVSGGPLSGYLKIGGVDGESNRAGDDTFRLGSGLADTNVPQADLAKTTVTRLAQASPPMPLSASPMDMKRG